MTQKWVLIMSALTTENNKIKSFNNTFIDDTIFDHDPTEDEIQDILIKNKNKYSATVTKIYVPN